MAFKNQTILPGSSLVVCHARSLKYCSGYSLRYTSCKVSKGEIYSLRENLKLIKHNCIILETWPIILNILNRNIRTGPMCEEFLKSGSNRNRPHYNERTEFQPFWLPQTLKQIETKSQCGTYLAPYLLKKFALIKRSSTQFKILFFQTSSKRL